MALEEYNKKRSFSKTPEPKGAVKKSKTGPLRFVVQKHDASHLHYDFRLELDGVLLSWAIPKGPSLNPKDKRLAMQTEDHPLSYATFEGTIPKGEYGGGEVIVWDEGVYMSAETSDPELSRKKLKSGLHTGDLKFVLLGEKLKGAFALIKLKGREENAWLLIKKDDEYATAEDITANTASVRSSRVLTRDTTDTKKTTVAKKKTKPLPTKTVKKKKDPRPHDVTPMLAKLVDGPFDREGWVFEIKWDGYRAIAEIDNGKVALYSRNGNSFTKAYPPVVEALSRISSPCVLDGEIIAEGKEGVSFQALQHYKEKKVPLKYAIFDVLYADGKDLRDELLIERKKYISSLIPPNDPVLFSSEHIETKGLAFFKEIEKKGMEGIMAKDAQSPYRTGARSDEWQKIKTSKEQEAIIVGYTAPRGSRKLIGALVLAVYQDGTLTYIGHSGGGFTGKELTDLHAKLSKIETKTSPLRHKVPVNSPITWVKPKYICQVQFSEWTTDGRMRHPIYKGLRTDKKITEVTREEEMSAPPKKASSKRSTKKDSTDGPTLTHLDKVYWPEEGYTKGDLIRYYDEMADILLPYLKDRPQNLNRHPNGIAGANFFQKNMPDTLPSFVETKEIWSESNNAFIRYVVCNNKETLLYLANLGCIELNPWHSRVASLENPDYMVLDLDPHGRSMEDLICVAKEIASILTRACEEFYIKTSGKTGLHMVIPLGAKYDYDAIRTFSELIMQLVHRELPDITSLERNPKRREGKLYLDYLQNRFGQTLASVYSVRPYKGATVSTPIHLEELRKGFTPAKFTIKTIGKRIREKGDLWKSVLGPGVDLTESIKCLEEDLP
jgi:bifunctional non-homologous end joining protein LigD